MPLLLFDDDNGSENKNYIIGNGEFEAAALKNRSTKDCPGMLMRAHLVCNAVVYMHEVRIHVHLVRNATGRKHKDWKCFRTTVYYPVQTWR